MLTPRQRAALWRWGFLALGLVALLLGFRLHRAVGMGLDRPHVHDALFKTVRSCSRWRSRSSTSRTPATQLASLLAPAATAGTLWLAFFGRILRRWQFFRLGWRPADDLFTGRGETAAAIAVRRNAGPARGNAPRIVGLDVVTDTPQRALREAGTRAPVFRGDARSRDYLDAVNAAGAARRVWC
ncbi:MAG: hypothetical protein U1F17_00865 [Burkholderiaceae bacterium]